MVDHDLSKDFLEFQVNTFYSCVLRWKTPQKKGYCHIVNGGHVVNSLQTVSIS